MHGAGVLTAYTTTEAFGADWGANATAEEHMRAATSLFIVIVCLVGD